MIPVLSSSIDDLFNLDLIRSYVDQELNPRFIERYWLKQQVEEKLANPDCRFLLLTAEPGAGKSTFMAWLAQLNPDWCRYFIRRSQRNPLDGVGVSSFLLRVGYQLAATYPELFNKEQLKIIVEQRIGTAKNSKVVGAEISKMFTSPFYEKVIQIQQQVTHSKDSETTGVRISELYATKYDLPIENLQFMALIDPAKAMMKKIDNAAGQAHRNIIVLVDALDELRYQDSESSLLKWLTNCPELPSNLRLILTSRPDDDLLRSFRGNQRGRIQEISILKADLNVTQDSTCYTKKLIETPEVKQTLIEMNQNLDEFTYQLIDKANGNLGYLGAIGRAIDEAICQQQQVKLREILELSELPGNLQDLYALFLSRIKDTVAKENVPVKDAEGKIGYKSIWLSVYKPILGILSVALEPLTPYQIQKLGLIQAELDYVMGAIEKLKQFLDRFENSYRLYHTTLPEFFTSHKAREKYNYCFVDSLAQNRLIITYYRESAESWANVNLKKISEDNYGRQHLAQHLVKSEQVEELHQLLRLEKDGKNVWFKLKDDRGETTSFLDDVELAWSQAKKAYDCQQERNIGLQCRYALIQASINSLARLPKELLIALAKPPNLYWNATKAFAYARQNPNHFERSESLLLLADQFPDSEILKPVMYESSFEAAEFIADELERAEALTALVDKYPKALTGALEAARNIQDKYDRAYALTMLVDKDPKTLTEALEAARNIQDKYDRAYALTMLADKDPKALTEVLMATLVFNPLLSLLSFWDSHKRTKILVTLVDILPQNKLPHEILCAIQFSIRDRYYRAKALAALADINPEVFSKALDTAIVIRNENERADALVLLVDKLPPDLLYKILDASKALKDVFAQAKVLTALADKLPELFPQALDAAITIRNEDERAEALIALALVDKLPPDLLTKVLSVVNAIGDVSSRRKTLTALADKLPPDLLTKVLDDTFTIKDTYPYARVLATLADKFPDMLPKALDAAIAIEDVHYRAQALRNLPRCFVLRSLITGSYEDFKRVFAVTMTILWKYCGCTIIICLIIFLSFWSSIQQPLDTTNKDKYTYSQFLTTLVDKLPRTLPKTLWIVLTNKVLAIKDECERTNALMLMINKLPPDLLYKILDATKPIKNLFYRAKILAALADKLPELFPQALDAAIAIRNENERAEVLVVLVDKLPPDLLPKVLDASKAIENASARAKSLVALADRLPSELPQALDAAVAIRNENNRAKTLAALIDKLSLDLLPKVLDTFISIEDKLTRAEALTALADKFPKALSEVLDTAKTIRDKSSRTKGRNRLDNKPPEMLRYASYTIRTYLNNSTDIKFIKEIGYKLFPDQLSKTPENDQDFKNEKNRALILTKLANKLSPELRIKTLFDFLDYRDRPSLLNDLTTLIPIINTFDDDAMFEIAQAIQDVSQWWP